MSKCFTFCSTTTTCLGSCAGSISIVVSLGCFRSYNCISCITIITFSGLCAIFCTSCIVIVNVICKAMSVCRTCGCSCICCVTIITFSCFCAVFCTSCIIVIAVICELVSCCSIGICYCIYYVTKITFCGFPSIFYTSSRVIGIFFECMFIDCLMIKSSNNAVNQIFEFCFDAFFIAVYFCKCKSFFESKVSAFFAYTIFE